jgi:hypothetical protein
MLVFQPLSSSWRARIVAAFEACQKKWCNTKKSLDAEKKRTYKARVDTQVSLPESQDHQSFVVLFNRSLKIMEIIGDALPEKIWRKPSLPAGL